ncbi:MAG: hypothetical protein IPG45_24720 [Deltaproteobacteria bacterium]|nr:hypothetical protein [Deltaproteobacteria bacterium]
MIALLAIGAGAILQVRLQTLLRHRGPVRRVAVPLLLLGLLLPTVAQASPAPLRWRSSAIVSGEGEISSGRASREGSSFGENRTSGFRLFLQVDPAGYQDSPNLYAGFGNDPVNNRDPTGRALIPEAKCEGGLSAAGLAHGVTTAVATAGGFLDWLRPGGHSWEEYQANIDHFRAVGVELYGCRSVVGAEVVGAVLIPGPDEAALAGTLKARRLVQVAKVESAARDAKSIGTVGEEVAQTRAARLPTGGKWTGEVGNSDFIPDRASKLPHPDDPTVVDLRPGEGVPFRAGQVDFGKHAVDEFHVPGLDGSSQDRTRMALAVAERYGLSGARGRPTAAAGLEYMERLGLVPHHAGGTRVQLVPHGLHGSSAGRIGIPHTGGAADLRATNGTNR